MRQLQLDFMTNALTIRWLRILNIIEQEPVFTLVDLSERLAVSHRTLVKDIQGMKQFFGETITLQAKQTGYHFEEVHHVCYKEKKIELVESEILFPVIQQIFKGEFQPIQELAHEYTYGESTFRRFLLRAEKSLKDYGLCFSLNPVTLVGAEENIRKFFYDFYYLGEFTSHTVRPPIALHKLVLDTLSTHLGSYEVGTGVSTSEFYFLLYLVMNRVQQGKRVTIPIREKTRITKENDFLLLYSLQGALMKEFKVKIPKEEFVWLYSVLVTQRTMDRIEQERLFYLRFNQRSSIKQIAGKFFSDPQYKRWDRDSLEDFLASFLAAKSLTHRLHPVWNKQQVEEKEAIMKHYLEAYQINHQFLLQYQHELKLEEPYFDDVVVAFTSFVNLLLETYSPKKVVLFLLEGDALVVQKLRQQAKQRLGSQHHLIFLPLQELTLDRITAKRIDLIVTNYRQYLFDYSFTTDALLVNTIPREKDWARIMQQLNQRIDTELV